MQRFKTYTSVRASASAKRLISITLLLDRYLLLRVPENLLYARFTELPV